MTQDTDKTSGTDDTIDRAYKDDPAQFGQASDAAQGRPSGHYSGDGPGERADDTPRPHGSQDWRKPQASNEHLESRSADPGQSSYGGFKGEGPATPDGHAPPDEAVDGR